MKTKAMFPGSFDPFHNGHLEILNKALAIFDEVVLYVAINVTKESFRSIDERVKLLQSVLNYHELTDRVSILPAKEGELTALVAKEKGITNIVRGIREKTIDEFEKYLMNEYLKENKNLVFTHIHTDLDVSSTVINENKGNKDVLELLVSESIIDDI